MREQTVDHAKTVRADQYHRQQGVMMNICGPGPENVAQIRERFEQYLRRAIDEGGSFTRSGSCFGGLHGGSWFDGEVIRALDRISAARPDPDPALIAAARDEFEKQLDGTHRAERKAEWDAAEVEFYPEWPDTPFAESVRLALEHVLTYVGDPWLFEEADAARADLDTAAGYAADHRGRTLIVERLRQMLGDIDVIPEYEIVEEPSATKPRPGYAVLVGARNSLVGLVRFVEAKDRGGLEHARIALRKAGKRGPSSGSRRRRDEGYLFEHVRLLLDDLDRGGGAGLEVE